MNEKPVDRKCTVCHERKALELFKKCARNPCGHAYTCRVCANKNYKEKYYPAALAKRRAKRAAMSAEDRAEYYKQLRVYEDSRDVRSVLYSRVVSRLRRNGIPFSFHWRDLEMPTHCPVLGVPLDQECGTKPTSPTLVLIDPSGGYVKGNVRIVSRAARFPGLKAGPRMKKPRRPTTAGPVL